MPIDTEESGESAAQVIGAMCLACIQEVSVDGGGVSLMTVQGYAGTVWASNPTAHRVEELQFTLGEGPCHDAVRSGVPVLAPNLSGDSTDQQDAALQARWPAFTPEVMHLGVQAIFGLPLRIGSTSLGAFDLYRQSSGPLSENQIAHARERRRRDVLAPCSTSTRRSATEGTRARERRTTGWSIRRRACSPSSSGSRSTRHWSSCAPPRSPKVVRWTRLPTTSCTGVADSQRRRHDRQRRKGRR